MENTDSGSYKREREPVWRRRKKQFDFSPLTTIDFGDEEDSLAVVFRELKAQNFRGFRDTGLIDLSDLNIFVGPNSAGKSSLLQVLLLLKQTLEDSNPENRLITDGRLIELGSFSDVVFRHDPKASLTVSLTFGEGGLDNYPWSRESAIQALVPDRFLLEFAATQRGGRTYLKSFSFARGADGRIVWGSSSSLGELKQWETSIELPKRASHLSFHHFLPAVWLAGPAGNRKLTQPFVNFLNASYGFRSLCDNVFGSLIHLQPIRTPIRTVYRVTGESAVSVGPTGENLLGVLHRDEKRRKPTRSHLLDHLNHWLDKRFDLVKGIKLEPLTRTKTLYALTGVDSRTNIAVNLAAVGFGVSQVAPIIVQGFLSPRNSCMLIEQPEIHLHPRAQAELGDLFIDFVDRGKQVFVETHSQYLLYRVMRRVAEKKLDASKVRVFFVSRTEDGSKVDLLALDDRGRIANWPKGFFEEGYEETAAMAEALVK